MMKKRIAQPERGFSLVELLIALVISAIIMGAAVTIFSNALSTRSRESSKTDAITSAQAALSVMSREIGNAGFGLEHNGLGWYDVNNAWFTDCTTQMLRFRTNVSNNDAATDGPGEDVAYYFDSASQSVLRHDRNTGVTSGIINRISNVTFAYQNYVNIGTPPTGPSDTTGKVTITLTVNLENVTGQPTNQSVTLKSDVTLRNSPYMLSKY